MQFLEYDCQWNGILSYTAFTEDDFYGMGTLWALTPPYSDLSPDALRYRFVPAFQNRKSIIFKKDINTIGFFLWCWMTDEEYEKDEYEGETVFARNERSDKLVVSDLIVLEDTRTCLKHLRHFFNTYYPDEERVYCNRGKRKTSLRITK